MKSGSDSNKDNVNRKAATALLLLLAAATTGQHAGAQGVDNYNQDALLPPEVVPLDPSTSNSMSAAQAANRQSQAGGEAGVPGLVNNGKGTISAKEFRQAAFENLYNQQSQGGAPQQSMQQGMQQGGMQQGGMQQGAWQNGGVSLSQGQNQYMNSPMGSMYQQDQMANLQPAQSQTLSGKSRNTPRRQDIRRTGFSNTASGLASFGAGALTATYLMRPSNMLWGLGMWGLTSTGFGVRNGFHF